MPRDKETGGTKGFAFLLYEDQRSTVLAVDNLNGAKVLDRTLRVDHVKQYRQPKVKNDDGELVDPEEESMNARPEMIQGTTSCPTLRLLTFLTRLLDDGAEYDSSDSSAISIDPEDPMRDYLIAKRKEEKAKKAGSRGARRPNAPQPGPLAAKVKEWADFVEANPPPKSTTMAPPPPREARVGRGNIRRGNAAINVFPITQL